MKNPALTLLACSLALLVSAQTNLLKKLPKKARKALPCMVFIKADTLYKQESKVLIKPFYMSAYEVSNADWRAFEAAMVAKHGAEKAKPFLPDTLVWRNPKNFNEPLVKYYYRHPAYSNYPVVGVSYTQIQAYINWKIEEAARILKESKCRNYVVSFRLPTANEMEFVLQDKYNGPLKNKRGNFMANYAVQKDSAVSSGNMGVASRINDNADITAPVKSYWPNKLGIYTIRGNVAEWTGTAIQTFAPDPKGVQYIIKGGSWIDGPQELKQDAQKLMYADSTNWSTGFRLVMVIKPSTI